MSDHIEAVLQNACGHLEHGNTAAAIATLQDLLAGYPACAPALQMLGMVHAMQGDMRGAARLLRQACVVAPENGGLRVHLARVEWELGLPAQAAASYQQAIVHGCGTPDIQVDYAIALQALKQYAAACLQCDAAIAQEPGHARAWNTRATLLHQQNHLEEALACHERALGLSPNAKGWSGKAATLDALGRFDDALACHDQAIRCDPGDASVWAHCGATLGKMGRHPAALACHSQATGLDPLHAFAWSNMGATLSFMDRGGESLDAHDKAISLQPATAAFWLQRGGALQRLGRNAEALASLNAAVRLDPASAQAWYHRGMALRAEHRLEEALESLDEACTLDAAFSLATIKRAEVLCLMGRDGEAFNLLENALAAHPDDHSLRMEMGFSQLAVGNFNDGWTNFQSCRRLPESEAPRHVHIPRWSGAEPLRGKRLLVYAEQGHGDVIQFCRYVPRAAALGCDVVFEVYPDLKQLMTSLGNCLVAARGEPLPVCDYCIPLMALPQALHAQPDDIPGQRRYLQPRKRLRPLDCLSGAGLKIGIACSGNPALPANLSRSVPLALFEPLQQHCTLVLLQNAVSARDAACLAENGHIRYPTAGFTDFADTADIIASLDLVISVDTSIAHLAGALGKPVWVLLAQTCDWRWCKDRDDSSWYLNARLFRQTREGDWATVLAQVDEALRQLALRARRLRQGAA